jgi:hypothetical protein
MGGSNGFSGDHTVDHKHAPFAIISPPTKALSKLCSNVSAPTPITREHGADARERSQHFRRYSAQTSTASRGAAAAAAAAAAAFYALLF